MIVSQAAIPAKRNKPAKGIKWDQYVELMKDRSLLTHLPVTMKLNKSSLYAMLSRYGTVYVKPNVGAFGVGVMRIKKLRDAKQSRFRVHLDTLQRTFQSLNEVYTFVMANKVDNDYLVQQGIDLLQWNKRPFDLRMMISKQNNKAWRNEGFVGRAAAPSKIVTNIRSGGTALAIEELLTPFANDKGKREIIIKLNQLGSRICERLESKYPGIRLFGIDVGLDRNLKPWVIEVNTRPEKICWKCMNKLLKKNSRFSVRR